MSLSIRNMNYTVQTLEHIEAQKQADWYASLAPEVKAEKAHYWFVERKARRGNGWIFVRDLIATKAEAAALFEKHFRNQSPKFRIRHLTAY